MITYEITENNEVLAWNSELVQTEPFLYQPHYPDGTPFESKEAAQAWAEKWVYELTHPEESDAWKETLRLKEIAKAKVLVDEPITEVEAAALAARLN